MKHLTLLCFLGLLLLPGSVVANPCVHPKRVVNGYTVDLQPLMDWWPAPKGVRPLSAWKHIRGSIVREVALGWVISGKVEGNAQATMFLLKNPPRAMLRRFEEDKRKLSEYLRAREEVRQYLKRPLCTDWYSYWLGQSQWRTTPISLTEHKQATDVLAELDRNIAALQSELAATEDANGNFKLDAFALKLPEISQGMPVYEHGAIYAGAGI